ATAVPSRGCRCSWCRGGSGGSNDTERALWLMFGVNSILTGLQIFFGLLANSLSLLGDGALMAMDGASYAVSLYAEKRKSSAEDATRLDKRAAFFSAAMLAATTAWVLFDVIERLLGEEREAAIEVFVSRSFLLDLQQQVNGMSQLHDIEVNSDIMIIFTAVNLAADLMVAFCAWNCGASQVLEEEDTSNLNLFGALAHLGADMVRGLAVLLAGILAEANVVDAAKADAYCSLFVCIFVLMATASLLKTVLQKSNPLAYAHVEIADEAHSVHGQATATCLGKSSEGSPGSPVSPVPLKAGDSELPDGI
ncbi:unnamed protein product, partial [Cladocopium goreaui]